MNLVFDTNVVLIYLRRLPKRDELDRLYQPFAAGNLPVMPAVVKGELKSIAIRNQYGEKRLAALERLIGRFLVADINSDPILDRYAEIEAFSQGKLPGRPLSQTARNMGKNDLWIAATASVLGLPLLTTDPDFKHLDPAFLTVHQVALR